MARPVFQHPCKTLIYKRLSSQIGRHGWWHCNSPENRASNFPKQRLYFPYKEPLFHRNEGSVSLKRRFCLDRAESSFFSPSLSTPTIYYRLFPSKYYTTVHIRQQRPTLFCRREISPYIYTAFNNECKTINHFNS